VVGSEQAGERPALVLSPDVIDEYGPVILIAAITSQKTERAYPFEVVVDPPEGGLRRRSKVMLMHLRVVDKHRLTGSYGTVSPETLRRVEKALQVATGWIPM
jgi:mRNA interferase MazF